MDCQGCWETVSAIVDGQASPAEEVAAERHLALCPACRDAAARTVAVTRLLRIRHAVPCPDLAPSLLEAFDRQVRGAVAETARAVPAGARPACVPEPNVLWGVGSAPCGCPSGCRCGCQEGDSCRCRPTVLKG
ncbi:hypothetical protein FNH05_04525 [Amycolatopsis rhizosphaerae]|uniref:Putative zinc-finger domain-containing protein n=1 Tax=Amycolatopsis rhizosphaerae TaxID=2053003 RepID=A0A558DHJ8_9PSEU|nr:hypothetical protein FNH05_04525 [Amycolatopsis rhizosphaerae]